MQKILLENKSHFAEGNFYYNLGTVYAKSKQFAIARYHLEKAIKKGFINTKILNNLDVVEHHLNVSAEKESRTWMEKSLDIGLKLPSSLYLTLSLVLILFFTLLISRRLIKKVSTIIIVVVISLTPFLFSKFFLENVNLVITLEQTSLREGPSKIYPEIVKIQAGKKFIIGEENNGWFYIKYPYSLAGWVYRDKLGIY